MIKTAICVYKTGGVYTKEYVKRLVDSIKQHSPSSIEVVCLSDDPTVSEFCTHIPLKTTWSGWWSKLELFAATTSAVYFDLDTVIRGDISSLYEFSGEFAMLSDFYALQRQASGIMIWNGDYSYIADDFTMEKSSEYNKTGKWGDQSWISERLTVKVDRIQTLYPGITASYKLPYTDEPIICFHGNPRPHTVNWKV